MNKLYRLPIIYTRLAVICLLCFYCSASTASGQVVKGYFPYYRSVAQANAVDYSQLTDLIYAFASIDANGNLAIMGDMAVFNAVKANCADNGVKLWIAIGGWGLSGNFSGVAADNTKRTTLANACYSLCTTHGLEGIDIDWEFPAAGDAANFTAMLAAIKGRIGPTYKLSAALGGESFTSGCVTAGHAVGVQAAAFTHLDYFNIMSYDAPSCYTSNHTSLAFMQASMDGWYAKGCPYEKMVPGIAFYGKPDPDNHMWNQVGNNSTHFNDADGIVSGYGYDTKPTIEAKTNYAMCTKGAAGMMIWEISQDLPSSSAYDLLPVVKAAVDACGCPFSDPDLGADLSLCGVASLTLNSGIATNGVRTFTWKRGTTTVAGPNTTANTLTNVTTAGTYEVTVAEDGCTKTDEVVVSNTLTTPDLGIDKDICNPASLTLAPSNSSSFPAGTTWQWSLGGSSITGETTTSLTNVRKAGTYRLTASVSGCSSTYDEIVITSSVPTPVDGCRPSAGSVALAITNATAGPYTWYDDPTAGSSVGTGTSINTPSISATKTYYVQNGAPGATGTVGKTTNAGGWNAGDFTHKIAFSVMQDLTINSITVYPASTQNVTIRVLQSDGVTVVASKTFTGVGTGAQVLNLNFSVPVGTGYLMDAVGTTGQLSYGGAFAFPSTIASVISITGQTPAYTESDRYNYFFNWSITSGSVCARLPVIATIGGCSSLPVELSDFSISNLHDIVQLNWTTAWEINNQYFEIQRSADNENFETIGRVNGRGTTSSVSDYSSIDAHPLSGASYYRLAQYDLDGSVSYSEIKFIQRGKETEVLVAPNPFEGHTSISLNDYNGGESLLRIYDITGNLLSEFSASAHGLEIGNDLVPGVYFVQVNTEGQSITKRIVKLN